MSSSLLILLLSLLHVVAFASFTADALLSSTTASSPSSLVATHMILQRYVGSSESAKSHIAHKGRLNFKVPQSFFPLFLHQQLRGGGQGTTPKGFSSASTTARNMTSNDDSKADSSTSSSDATSSASAEAVPWNDVVGNPYHLIWSKGFQKHFLISVGLLIVWHFGISKTSFVSSSLSTLMPFLPTSHNTHHHHHHEHCATSSSGLTTSNVANNIGNNIILPLLSSSCCLLQIVINILVSASGCIGFNTYLGPIRPCFLSLLLYTTTLQLRQRTNSAKISATLLLRFSIAFLPELLDLWNTNRHRIIQKFRTASNGGNSGIGSDSTSSSSSSLTIEIDIPKMGCVACINKIDNSIRNAISSSSSEASPNYTLDDASSWLLPEIAGDDGVDGKKKKKRGGRARVQISGSNVTTQDEISSLKERVLKAIGNAGFGGEGCKIRSTNDSK